MRRRAFLVLGGVFAITIGCGEGAEESAVLADTNAHSVAAGHAASRDGVTRSHKSALARPSYGTCCCGTDRSAAGGTCIPGGAYQVNPPKNDCAAHCATELGTNGLPACKYADANQATGTCP